LAQGFLALALGLASSMLSSDIFLLSFVVLSLKRNI